MKEDRRKPPGQAEHTHRPPEHAPRVAPGKVTLTSKLRPESQRGAQRKPSPAQGDRPVESAPGTERDDGPVEDWMRVAMRPDLHQQPIMRARRSEVGYAGDEPPAAAASGGAPMPAEVQGKMEAALGADFSQVRIHQGPQASAIGALAYTRGTDVHFAPGHYDPHGQRGQELLGHELAHVVQQAQGRVHATEASAQGVPINADPALEREADVLGARAARAGEHGAGPGAESSGLSDAASSGRASQRVTLAEPVRDAPLQGYFAFSGSVADPVWRDTDTDLDYLFDSNGPGSEGRVRYLWVRPGNGQGPNIPIRYLGNNRWERLSDDERREEDRIAQSMPAPPGTSSDTMDLDEDTESSEQAQPQPYTQEVAERGLREVYEIAKLSTSFTASVNIIPVQQGHERHSWETTERRYEADQVWVEAIAVSDADRPETRFDTQQSHTVAWTLVRNSLMRLTNRTVKDLLAHFSAAFTSLGSFAASDEAEAILAQATKGGILVSMQAATLPVDRWQETLSRLIRLYAQAYQLSTAATYKRGAAKGHGESTAMARLEADEQAVTGGQQTRPGAAMAKDAKTLLDVQFRESLGVAEYAFSVHHWMDSLRLAFPELMAAHGDALTATVLDTTLAKSFLAKVNDPNVKTVRDLLRHHNYDSSATGATNAAPARSLRVTGRIALPNLALAQLKTSFVANVSVAPQEQQAATRQNPTVEMAGSAPRQIPVDAWHADQLRVHSMVLGNMDRPKTKFIQNQKSHTVAWTLVRHHIASFSGQPLTALLAFLERNFSTLLGDIRNPEGRQVAQTALATVRQHRNGTYPLYDWQPLMSTLVRWYFIAYQVSDSASYVNPDEAERAQGHGEARHMLVLRRNEFSLSSGGSLADPGEQVAIAATALFDASVTPTLDRQGITNALAHWREAMLAGFPNLVAREGQNMLARMLARPVDGLETLHQVVTAQGRTDLLS